MASNGNQWPAELEARLIELCKHDNLSAGQIGLQLGFTRNAIIGKAGRLKIKLPNAGKFLGGGSKEITGLQGQRTSGLLGERVHRAKRRSRQYSTSRLPPEAVPEAHPDPDSLQLGIHELRWPVISQCRWIEGEPDHNATYCGSPTVNDTSYCAKHYAMAFRPYVWAGRVDPHWRR